MSEKFNIKVLVSPLDWGLGHATRCIPIIKQLLITGCKVIIACDGPQEKLLKKEFPNLTFTHLAGYNIQYSTNKRLFPFKIIIQLPKILKAIKNEQKWLEKFIQDNEIDAVISDNRYGLFHPKLTCIFITHQLLIRAPFKIVEECMQKINYRLIEKFTECWVPDITSENNIAGTLSHPIKLPKKPVKYIGGLSRLEKTEANLKYYLAVIISGPEPQRSVLEKKVFEGVKNLNRRILLVRGLPGSSEKIKGTEFVTIVNHLPSAELSIAMNESEFIISRSGYTTIMDILKLQKKSILIPTPGQTEQEYLADHLQKQGWCFSISQDEFSLPKVLKKAETFNYSIPLIDMEAYKEIVRGFVRQVR